MNPTMIYRLLNVVTRQTATKYLGELVSAGVLREEKVGREKLFVNEGLMDILKSEVLTG